MCVSFGRGLCLCDGRRKNENDDSDDGMSSVAFFVMSLVFFVCAYSGQHALQISDRQSVSFVLSLGFARNSDNANIGYALRVFVYVRGPPFSAR